MGKLVDGQGEAPSGDELDRLTPDLPSTAPSSQSQPAMVPPTLSIPSKPQLAEIPLLLPLLLPLWRSLSHRSGRICLPKTTLFEKGSLLNALQI